MKKLTKPQERCLALLISEGSVHRGDGPSTATMGALADKRPELVERRVGVYGHTTRDAFGRGNYYTRQISELSIHLRECAQVSTPTTPKR